jgi:hypothetical protein
MDVPGSSDAYEVVLLGSDGKKQFESLRRYRHCGR